jgi:hypothetical protein
MRLDRFPDRHQLAVVGAGDPDVAAVGELQELPRPIASHNEVTSPSPRSPDTVAICSGGGLGGSGRKCSPRAPRPPRQSIGHPPSPSYSGTARWPGQPGSAGPSRFTQTRCPLLTNAEPRLARPTATGSQRGSQQSQPPGDARPPQNAYLCSSAACQATSGDMERRFAGAYAATGLGFEFRPPRWVTCGFLTHVARSGA